MKVIRIFDEINGCVWSVQYVDEAHSALAALFLNWTDVAYLENFFELHRKDLESDFYGSISVEEAVFKTLNEAEVLRQFLYEITLKGAENMQFTLQTIFKPLNNKDTFPIPNLQKTKLKGKLYKSWLRIYAIRIAPHLVVITGGAIKLTPTMNDRDHLLSELEKLDVVKKYLQEQGLLDQDDFEFLELE